MLYLELFVHARPARRPGGQEVRHVGVEEVRGHRGVAAQDGLHQGIVDEHVLLLQVSDRGGNNRTLHSQHMMDSKMFVCVC